VDASFFWGFIITQLLGGIVTTYFSAHLVFGSAIFFSSRAVMVVRLIRGLADGVTIPATFGILRWGAPPLERTSLVNLALSGCYVGSAIGNSLSGFLIELLGWDALYYCY
jgi:ACS family sodium-dependent inorganic phosphate cotransporter